MPKPPPEKRKVLIVVRTYPTPATKGVEVSCTAAITEDRRWMRLFPVPYRYLDEKEKFSKYQWVEVSVRKASDTRPESYHLIWPEAITILTKPLDTKDAWRERRQIVEPLRAHCMCCLKKTQDEKGFPTLGIIRPRQIKRLIIEPDDPNWSQKQLEILRQNHLFEKKPDKELEKVPYKFSYEFNCDHDECTSHTMICTDWEMGQSWRSWRDTYGDDWESKFRQRYEEEMINKYDTHFYVGTVHRFPKSWIIVGLFYPPKVAQPPETQSPLFT